MISPKTNVFGDLCYFIFDFQYQFYEDVFLVPFRHISVPYLLGEQIVLFLDILNDFSIPMRFHQC